MWNRLRQFATFVIIVAVAVAGVLPAHHALAASHPQPFGKVIALYDSVDCHHQGGDLQGASHHAGGPHDDAIPPGHDHRTTKNGANLPDFACCATACAAIAFIFATFSFAHSTVSEIFDPPLTHMLRPAALAAIDPPPRTG